MSSRHELYLCNEDGWNMEIVEGSNNNNNDIG